MTCLSASRSVVGNEALVAFDSRRHDQAALEIPLALGGIGEGGVAVLATCSEERVAIMADDGAAERRVDVVANVDLDRREGAFDASADVGIHGIEVPLLLQASIVAEDDTDPGVELILASDGACDGAGSSQKEGGDGGEGVHFRWFVRFSVKKDRKQRK